MKDERGTGLSSGFGIRSSSILERVMIISGESSGELYGALLAAEMKRRNPGVSIMGVGGDKMRSAGVSLVSGISSSFGLVEALKTYGEIRKTYREVIGALKAFKPQVLVLIDYPDFNMRLAEDAKRAGIKILYYVSPQVWAWRKKRIKTIGRLVDMMAVILPFEEKMYLDEGIPCEFVGHPAADEIRKAIDDSGCGIQDIGTAGLKAVIRKELGLAEGAPVVAFMPGSRHHEVKRLLPVMTAAMEDIKSLYPDCRFVVPAAPNLNRSTLSLMQKQLKKMPGSPPLIAAGSIKALLASDAAVIASGTSTLQAALLKIPMTVVYKLSPVTFMIGKLVVKVKHISLVNILLDKSEKDAQGLRIKELLQGDADSANILSELRRMLDDNSYRSGIVSQLEKIGNMFFGKNASLRVSEIAEGIANT